MPEGKIEKIRDLNGSKFDLNRKKEYDEKQKQKFNELNERTIVAQKFHQMQIDERNKRLNENRNREQDHRLQVFERKQKLLEADLHRKEAILRRNQERDARIDSLLKNRREQNQFLNRTFAFGSSTPRLLDPQFECNTSFWNQRRSTSTNNMCTSINNSLICNRNISKNTNILKKRSCSSTHHLNNGNNSGGVVMSTSMYEVFNWNNNSSNISLNSIQDIDQSSRINRRRTDLIPTIPSNQSSIHLLSASKSNTSLSIRAPNKFAKEVRPKSIAITGITHLANLNDKKVNNQKGFSGKTKSTNALPTKIHVNDNSVKSANQSQYNLNVKNCISTEEEAKSAISARRRLVREQERLKEKQKSDLDANNQQQQTMDVLVKSEPEMDIETKLNVETETQSELIKETEIIDDLNQTTIVENEIVNDELDQKSIHEKFLRERAEKMRLEMVVERLEKEEQERVARRKRVEAIMLRTRSATSNTSNQTNSELVSTKALTDSNSSDSLISIAKIESETELQELSNETDLNINNDNINTISATNNKISNNCCSNSNTNHILTDDDFEQKFLLNDSDKKDNCDHTNNTFNSFQSINSHLLNSFSSNDNTAVIKTGM